MLHPFSDPRRGLIALAISAAGAAAIQRIWDLPEAQDAMPR